MNDLTHIKEEGHTKEDWDLLIKAMDSKERVKIPEWFYWYFLEVLPPKKMIRNGFLFAEGNDYLRVFTRFDSGCFVVCTEELAGWD